MKKLILFAFFTFSCSGQVYSVTKQTVLAAAAETITIQQPATGSRQVSFISVYLDCSVACSWTLLVNGTAATSTTLAVNNVNPGELAAKTTAWSASNVGTGTTVQTYNCASACALSIDLTGFTFPQGTGTGTNLTIKSSSITGTVDINFKYSEKSL